MGCHRLGSALMLITSVSVIVAFVDKYPCRHHINLLQKQNQYYLDAGKVSFTTKRFNSFYEGDYDMDLLSDLRQTSYHALLEGIPPSVQVVLIGEGTHGTEEFFRVRSEVTQCLVQHHGFNAILCEGDVQPFFELNNFVTTETQPRSSLADTAVDQENSYKEIRPMLSKLFCTRFPDWMWSNVPMAQFVSWLQSYNNQNTRQDSPPVQLVGMDIQSPFDSMDYLIEQLSAMGETALSAVVRESYGPLLKYRSKIRSYGNDVYGNKMPSQESAVKKVLGALLSRCESKNPSHSESHIDDESIWFQLTHRARAIAASEAYHRQRIYPGHTVTWNLRTKSMMNSIDHTLECIHRISRKTTAAVARNEIKRTHPRLVVWAHNSHISDMRSTGYSSLGQISLGQLCREQFGEDGAFLIGMTTYKGTVRAAHADKQGACWKGCGEIMELKKATSDSHENVLHSIAKDVKSVCGEQAFGLNLRKMRLNKRGMSAGSSGIVSLDCNRNERFVGSCYLPQSEMMSHYTKCNMATQFDYVIHFDTSSAITI